jgi:hypothetical protein
MHWLRSFLRGLSRLWHWLRAEYGFFRAHRPAYAPVTVPPLPPHLRADSGSLDQHLEFIKNLYEQENDRKTVLESKAAQLLGQAGVVLSLVGILIPLLADSLKQPWLLSVVMGLFSVTMLLFTNAVYHASSLTKVWRWRYMQPGAENMFTQYDPPTDPALPYEPYKSELVRDYYQSFKHNQTVNDQKANFLSFGANSFTSALLLMGVLVLGLLLKPDTPTEARPKGEPAVRVEKA